MTTNRRTFIKTCSLALLAPAVTLPAAPASNGQVTFGFTQYGMKTLSAEQALRTCAEIGYDAIELALLAGYPTEPKQLSPAQRKDLRKLMNDLGLSLPALMENISAPVDDKVHAVNLEKIKAAAQLAYDLSPDQPPVLETVMGGAPKDWANIKDRMVERIKSWAETAAASKIILAGKPHVSGAVNTPDDALWIWKQVNHPAFKLAYDYSHYQLRNFKLAESLNTIIAQSVFIHVKDAKGDSSKFEFILPGDGTLDYVEYLKLVKASGYHGSVVVEVSGQVFNKPGYDPIVAAKRSYANLAPAFKAAGLRSK